MPRLTIRSPKAAPLAGGLLVAATALLAAATTGTPGRDDQERPAPGPRHAWIAKRAGTWDTVTKWRRAPDAPWLVVEGREVCKMGCGGFWLLSRTTADLQGRPYEGHQQIGYDERRKKFVWTWIDSAASWPSIAEGTLDDAGRVITYLMDTYNPLAGRHDRIRVTVTHEGSDRIDIRMFAKRDGKDFVAMEALHRRVR